MSSLSHAEWTHAQKTAAVFAKAWSVVLPSDSIRDRAQQTVEKYDLRAGDAFQLAAALEWCEDDPRARTFIAADERLLQAALLAGFDATKI
jgi:predicted nucleic acid-binding protein